jgi:hypothetical protein
MVISFFAAGSIPGPVFGLYCPMLFSSVYN